MSNILHKVVDETEGNLAKHTIEADIIVSATGQSGLLTPNMLKASAVVVDVSGDVAPEVYNRDDLTITPVRGGVGPLTICALFENLLKTIRK